MPVLKGERRDATIAKEGTGRVEGRNRCLQLGL